MCATCFPAATHGSQWQAHSHLGRHMLCVRSDRIDPRSSLVSRAQPLPQIGMAEHEVAALTRGSGQGLGVSR